MKTDSLAVDLGGEAAKYERALSFYRRFKDPGNQKCLLFGYNRYAQSVMKYFHVDGIIDDFSEREEIDSVPVIKSHEISGGSLVLAVSGGRPLTVRERLSKLSVEFLDYFAFRNVAVEPLCPIHFNEGFEQDFQTNRHKYEWVYTLLADPESKECFTKLVNFRLSYDLDFLNGFVQREESQYFESFLNLSPSDECFADIGAFDGFTSESFIKLCPQYHAIHVFEPDANNLAATRKRLCSYSEIYYHNVGLSDKAGVVGFASAGSGSKFSGGGEQQIRTDRLDAVSSDDFTFLKMDIEGAELAAIEGARETIARCHPKIAVAIYHCSEGPGPFWSVPEKVLAIRSDYKIYIRHYTESIYETVMFFIPVDKGVGDISGVEAG